MKACTKEQMRQIDMEAEKTAGIPSIVLMENAALGCISELCTENTESIGIFCGKGNNAGDGFAIARHLAMQGRNVTVYLVCGETFSGDCLVNYQIICHMGLEIILLTADKPLESYVRAHDIIIDAIFGTGVRGTITGLAAEIIQIINLRAKYVLSVDVPSGINSNTGEICGVCIRADKTVTFAAYKLGMLLFPASGYTGEVVVKNISIPEYIIERQNIDINVMDRDTAQKLRPQRTPNSHKGDYGKILVIAGSIGMTGAAYLSAQAALTCGSGIVTLAIPQSLNSILEQKLTEVMTLPLADENGHFAKDCVMQLCPVLNTYDAVLFGPGIGRGESIVSILSAVLREAQVPVIIDADGLYALAKNKDMLRNCSCSVTITPHSGEMARLAQISTEQTEQSRLDISRAFAEQYGVTVVLKGHHTVVTGCGGKQYINITGNSGMATAGSGDVLGGIIASLNGRKMEEVSAAALGVYLHGLAGDIAAQAVGEDCLTAQMLIDCLPEAILR